MGSVVKAISAANRADGKITRLRFHLESGDTTTVNVPFDQLQSLWLQIGKLCAEARELQKASLAGTAPKEFYGLKPLKVDGLGGAVATDGTPILTVKLSAGLELDLALRGTDIPALIEWLGNFGSVSQSAPSRSTH